MTELLIQSLPLLPEGGLDDCTQYPPKQSSFNPRLEIPGGGGMGILVEDQRQRDLLGLAEAAWAVRRNARLIGSTAVGCAVTSSEGGTWVGCNVEHRFRSHDVHAEVNAISSMVAAGTTTLSAVVVAAAREQFTPCGACMDWIFEFGGADCLVAWQGQPGETLNVLTAGDLMPYYPC